VSRKHSLRCAVVLAGLVAFGRTVRADEVVQFTNGAEMTVQSHIVEKDMVKLDLGGNNYISFPLTMVDKIASAGQDVFRNPTYYPSNQAIAGVATNGTPAFGVSGDGRTRQAVPGQAGMRFGEASDGYAQNDNYGSAATTMRQNPHDDMGSAGRPHLDPLRPLPLGGVAVIEPPGAKFPQGTKSVGRMQPRGFAPPPSTQPNPQPPANNNNDQGSTGQEGTPQGGDGSAEPPPSTPEPPPNN